MELAIRNAAGAMMLLSTTAVMAQGKVPAPTECASCPPPPPKPDLIVPSDPTLLVALGIFGVGVLVGAGLTKIIGSKNSQ